MKSAIQFLTLVVILVGFVAIQGCKKDKGPGETVEDQQLGKLSKTWVASAVSLDGVDKTADYANFTLTISGTAGATSFGYSRSGATVQNPWPSSGNWSFSANPVSEIVRDPGTADELPLTYAVTETTLEITFDFSGEGYPAGRVDQVKGSWIFEFTAQ